MPRKVRHLRLHRGRSVTARLCGGSLYVVVRVRLHWLRAAWAALALLTKTLKGGV